MATATLGQPKLSVELGGWCPLPFRPGDDADETTCDRDAPRHPAHRRHGGRLCSPARWLRPVQDAGGDAGGPALRLPDAPQETTVFIAARPVG